MASTKIPLELTAYAPDADGATLELQTTDTTVTDGSVLGKIEFKAPKEASGTDAILVGAAIEAVAEGTFAADNNATELVFKTGASEAAAQKMMLTSAGHLSVGATSITNGGGYNKVIQVSGTEGCFSAISGSNEGLFAQNGVNTQVINRANGYMEFRANNTEYFRIAAGQIDVKSADLTMQDSRSLYFGAGNDLRIYHNGSHSYISDQGTGNLHILTNHLSVHNAADDAIIFHANEAGHVIMPNQPCFSAPASHTNIPLTTQTTVTLGTERFDNGSNLSGNTFTAPIGGKYLFTYILYFSSLDSAHTTLDVTMKTSNTQYQQTINPSLVMSNDGNFSLTGSMICDMDTNDTWFIRVYVSGGTAQTDIHTDSHVSGCLIA